MGITPVIGAGSIRYIDIPILDEDNTLPNGTHSFGNPTNLHIYKNYSDIRVISSLLEFTCNIKMQVIDSSSSALIRIKCSDDREIRHYVYYDSNTDTLKWIGKANETTCFTRYNITDNTNITMTFSEQAPPPYINTRGIKYSRVRFNNSTKQVTQYSDYPYTSMSISNSPLFKEITARYYTHD